MFIWLITFYNKKTSRATFFGRTASFFPAVIATAPFFLRHGKKKRRFF